MPPKPRRQLRHTSQCSRPDLPSATLPLISVWKRPAVTARPQLPAPGKVCAVVFDDGRQRAALVGVDLLFITRALTKEAQAEVEKRCGIKAGNIRGGSAARGNGGQFTATTGRNGARQLTPRRWGLGNPTEETSCCRAQNHIRTLCISSISLPPAVRNIANTRPVPTLLTMGSLVFEVSTYGYSFSSRTVAP
jgi:hypothetical protein